MVSYGSYKCEHITDLLFDWSELKKSIKWCHPLNKLDVCRARLKCFQPQPALYPTQLDSHLSTMGLFRTIIMVIIAIILPPLAVGIQTGLSSSFFLNLLLTLLGWIPGVIHALFLLFTAPTVV
jgi:uncharacterized membrane protein YqaE (UPF0057 family)